MKNFVNSLLGVGFAIALAFVLSYQIHSPKEDHMHHWSMWTNLDNGKLNDFGYIWQSRYCTNCGLVQTGMH